MKVLRRAWRVFADRPQSEAAALLRLVIPMEIAAIALGIVLPYQGWPFPPPHRLIDVAWMYAVLWVVRQRDEARAEPKPCGASSCRNNAPL